jgi:2-keto-3-deoxy-L-rhamnonate aldolase RhmA
MARVLDLNFAPSSRVLDAGARGAMVPRVETRQQTEEIVSPEVRPQGKRGVASMGLPGQFDHPRFLQAMEDLVAVCRRHGVAPGCLPATEESAAHWISKGFRMLSLGSDIGVFSVS